MACEKLRDQLLNLEPYPEDLKMRIQQEIAATRERPLKRWERWLLGIGGVALAVVIPYKLSLLGQDGLFDSVPAWCLALFGAFVLLGCGGLVYMVRSVKRGTMRHIEGNYLVYGSAALVLLKLLSEVYAEGAPSGIGIIAGVVVATALIFTRVEAAELRLRERQLRTELALAELEERLTAREGDK